MTSRLRLSGIALATAVAAGTLSTVAAVPSASASSAFQCSYHKTAGGHRAWWIDCTYHGYEVGQVMWYPNNPEKLTAYDGRADHQIVIARLDKDRMSPQYVYDTGGRYRAAARVPSRNWDKTHPQLCLIWGRDRHAMRCMT